MRIADLVLSAAVCCFVAPAAMGQSGSKPAPAPDEEEFVMVSTAPPAPKVVAAAAPVIDPLRMTESVATSVVNAQTYAGGSTGWDSKLGVFSTGKPDVDLFIVESGMRHGVDPKLIASVMHQESRFNEHATSSAGACGYMQLMPGTARRFGVTDIYDARQNIDAGAKYLRFLLDLFHNDVGLALAGYNAGEYRVIREGYRVPNIRETQNYVRLITARYFGNTQFGGSKNRVVAPSPGYVVTIGQAAMTDDQREQIRRAALASTSDRGLEAYVN